MFLMTLVSAWFLFLVFMVPGLVAVGPRRFLEHRRRAATISAACWAVFVVTDRLAVDWRLGVVLALAMAGAYSWRFRPRMREVDLPPYVTLAAVGLFMVVAFGVQAWLAYPNAIPKDPTPWYYAGLAEQTARSGGYPLTSPEWGQQLPFLRDYPYFTSVGAAASRFMELWLPLHARMEAFRLFTAIIVAWWAAEFFLVLTEGTIAIVMGGLVLATYLFSHKLSGYRPEAFAYAPMFLFLANALSFGQGDEKGSLRLRHDWGSLLEIVAPLLLCFLSHGVVAVVALAGYVSFAGVRLLRRGRWRRAAVELVVVVVGTMALYFAADAAVTGGMTQVQNATSSPEAEDGSSDLSFEFFRQYCGTKRGADADIKLRSTARLKNSFGIGDVPWWAVVGIGIISLLIACLLRRTRTRAIGIALWALLLGVIGAAFVLLWDTYVPQRTGPTRIWPLLTVTCCAAAALALSVVEDAIRRRGSGGGTGIVTVVSICLALAFFWQVNLIGVKYHKPGGLSKRDYDFLTSLELEPGAVVLSNGLSEGSIAAMTGGNCYVGGVAPYTKDVAILQAAVNHMIEARKFFRRPTPAAACSMGLDYIIVGRKRWSLGIRYHFPTWHKKLEQQFELVAEHPRKRAALYRVDCP
jgi:hypothetical protein